MAFFVLLKITTKIFCNHKTATWKSHSLTLSTSKAIIKNFELGNKLMHSGVFFYFTLIKNHIEESYDNLHFHFRDLVNV